MQKNPLVTVLMPVYNCELYIAEAIGSILHQTYQNFEFLIIDDASNDTTVSIIKTFEDPRIHLIEKPKNSGYTESLNYGLRIAKGKYIARMDGDDVSLPERLKVQVAYMEAHPEVVACGAFYTIMDQGSVKVLPKDHEAIKVCLLDQTCFAHPVVMLRKAVLDTCHLHYDVTKEPAEDYALWVTLLKYGKLYNIDKVLLQYRIHEQQVSIQRRTKQLESKLSTRIVMLGYLLPEATASYHLLLKQVLLGEALSYEAISVFLQLKTDYITANIKQQFIPKEAFNTYMNSLMNVALKAYFLKRHVFTTPLIKHYLTFNRGYGFSLPLKTVCILFFKGLIGYKKPIEVEKN
jgi:glycosyltransferase involved in cell wall biosynthesis